MHRPGDFPTQGQPVEARTASGRASFQRNAPTAATLDIKYTIAPQTVALPDGDLQQGVEELCAAEIDGVRAQLSDLGEQLAGQLSTEGKAPRIQRRWQNSEMRSWQDQGQAFSVDASQTHLRETLRGYEGASDAQLVREHVRLLIEQREQNIRGIYGQILTDARASRGEPRAAERN